jgi:hypothetical protein
MTPPTLSLSLRTVPLLLAALLASCGGGSEDSGGASSNTPYQGTLLNGTNCTVRYYAQSQPSQRAGTDPLYLTQWYLKNTGRLTGYSGLAAGEDLQVENVWASGLRGENIRVAVVDDALEVTHQDLAPNVVEGASYNYVSDGSWQRGSPWPLPCTSSQTHGTAVGGVVAARDGNGLGGRGVAPRASLVGYNALANDLDSEVLDALVRDQGKNHIYNNSWGAEDDGHFNTPASRSAQVGTILNGLRNGRNGLGSIYTFAGGNGGANGDYSVLDGNVSMLGAIPVCGTNAAGKRAPYSEPGPNLIVCAPSSDMGQAKGSSLPDVTTTTLQNQYTAKFNGTSAATPMISGVIALMLQANPNLTWRDVPLVLARSARQVDPTNAGWTSYGGYHYNHEYGFGVADATAAVQLARSWQSVGSSSTLRQCGPYSATVNQAIPETTPVSDAVLENPFADASGLSKAAVNGVTSRISAAGCGIQHIEHVEVVLTATDDTGARAHPSAGDLQITLTSPAGQTSTLTTPHLCYNISGQQTSCQGLVDFSFGLSRHLEEPAISGTSSDWTLAAADRRTGNTGRLRNWSITLYGR